MSRTYGSVFLLASAQHSLAASVLLCLANTRTHYLAASVLAPALRERSTQCSTPQQAMHHKLKHNNSHYASSWCPRRATSQGTAAFIIDPSRASEAASSQDTLSTPQLAWASCATPSDTELCTQTGVLKLLVNMNECMSRCNATHHTRWGRDLMARLALLASPTRLASHCIDTAMGVSAFSLSHVHSIACFNLYPVAPKPWSEV